MKTNTSSEPGDKNHKNSGSTSSSGCSSMAATESTEALCDQSSAEFFLSDISPSADSMSSVEDSSASGAPMLLPVQDRDISTSITTPPASGVVYGCPNVSLSPIFEHRLSSISSISSGRNNSFDEGDTGTYLLAEVLVVAHGGLLKELLRYFVQDLGCKIPGGKEHALKVSPNCGLSRFTVSIFEDDDEPKLTCLTIHDKDHLVDVEALPCVDASNEAF